MLKGYLVLLSTRGNDVPYRENNVLDKFHSSLVIYSAIGCEFSINE